LAFSSSAVPTAFATIVIIGAKSLRQLRDNIEA
jgi:aryl-alcohol dehydrogenase-like predicted oxidoreductase